MKIPTERIRPKIINVTTWKLFVQKTKQHAELADQLKKDKSIVCANIPPPKNQVKEFAGLIITGCSEVHIEQKENSNN